MFESFQERSNIKCKNTAACDPPHSLSCICHCTAVILSRPGFCNPLSFRIPNSDRRTQRTIFRPSFVLSSARRLPDIVVPEHESSIFRSFIQPCMWFLHDGTGYTLYCLASVELAWHFQNHIQGWLNDLNMLLSCSGTTMSVVAMSENSTDMF